MNKPYEELTFADNFMFCKILSNDLDLCKDLLELILGFKISKVELSQTQKEIDIKYDSKAVRLDVYVEDGKNTVYDIEMQKVDTHELPKRSRYYQAMIDLNLIEKGDYYAELRKWLNNEFYKIAFDRFERAMIKETTIRNDDNAESGTIGGNDTIDRVFILSVDDMGKKEYGFDLNIEAYDESRRCSPTEYAVSQGAYQYFGTGSNYLTSEGKGAGFWWLRSPGKSGDYAASVNSRGYVRDYGDSVRVGANAVRPAMWIKIKSE